jgi:hypothetical protein
MEEPGSKKSEGSGRIMRDRNDMEERGDEEEERTTPVRRGPQRMLWPFSFSPLSSIPSLTTLIPTQHPPPA